MKKLVFILLISVSLTECRDKKDCCPDPAVINPAWLNAQIISISASPIGKSMFIMRGELDGMCVVYVDNCCINCNTLIIVYRCDGTRLDNVDLTKIKNQTIAWRPNDFECKLM
jgi:hypothetical protein